MCQFAKHSFILNWLSAESLIRLSKKKTIDYDLINLIFDAQQAKYKTCLTRAKYQRKMYFLDLYRANFRKLTLALQTLATFYFSWSERSEDRPNNWQLLCMSVFSLIAIYSSITDKTYHFLENCGPYAMIDQPFRLV